MTNAPVIAPKAVAGFAFRRLQLASDVRDAHGVVVPRLLFVKHMPEFSREARWRARAGIPRPTKLAFHSGRRGGEHVLCDEGRTQRCDRIFAGREGSRSRRWGRSDTSSGG